MALAEAIHSDDLTERMLVVRQVPLLSGLSPPDRAAVASMMRERNFAEGEVISRDSEPVNSFFAVVEGRIRLSRAGKYWRTFEAPGAIGYMAMIARAPGGSGAVAETDVRAFEMDREAMQEVFEDHSAVLLEAIRLVATGLVGEMKSRPPPPGPMGVSGPDAAFIDPGRSLDLVERIFFLRKMRAFSTSNVNALAELSQRMVERRFAAGEVAWKPGDVADHVLMVVSGKVELVHGETGRVQVFGPGSPIGGAESMAGHKRWNTFRAVEPTLALRGAREEMLDVFEDNLDVAQDFLAVLAGVLLRYWDQRASDEGASPSERLAASTQP
jgi:CRP-like cAMP-binding protein